MYRKNLFIAKRLKNNNLVTQPLKWYSVSLSKLQWVCGLLVSILVAYCIMIVKEKKYFRINKYLKNGKKFPFS